jgi:hypothetical protein
MTAGSWCMVVCEAVYCESAHFVQLHHVAPI